ncbi:MAG: F0F1 ATP synthase subunit A [bacterium]|nr:F0F1 ATP synthase subunit A [bacterium]
MEAEAPFLLQFLVNWLNPILGKWIPINATIVMTWLISIGIIVFAMVGCFSLKMIPKGAQNLLEILIEQILQLMEGMIGHKKAKFFLPLMGTLALFILVSNLIGLVPGLKAPTGDLNTTIALALIVFILTHFFGIKEKGLIGYLKHFVGPIWWLAPLMVPIHFIGELAKPFSLSIRLFANMMSKHMALGCLALLIIIFSKNAILFAQTLFIPLFLPPVIMMLGVLTCLIQTFVFVFLAIVYISIAMEEEEH